RIRYGAGGNRRKAQQFPRYTPCLYRQRGKLESFRQTSEFIAARSRRVGLLRSEAGRRRGARTETPLRGARKRPARTTGAKEEVSMMARACTRSPACPRAVVGRLRAGATIRSSS